MKKLGLLGIVILLVVSVSLFSAGQKEISKDGEKIRLGISLMTYEHEFMQDILATVRMHCNENSVELFDVDGQEDVGHQLSGIEDMINSKNIDGLLLNPVDTDAIAPAVFEANDAGIPVVTMDVSSAKGDVYAHVASNNKEIGREVARFTVGLLEERNGDPKGKVVILGYSKITSMRDRVDGFKEIMEEYPNVELIEREPIKLSVTDCTNLAEDNYTTFGKNEIDVYYGSNGTTLEGLIAAQYNTGRDDFQLVGVDDLPLIVEAIQNEDSTLEAFVAQTPTEIGKKAFELINDAINGKPSEKQVYDAKITLVTRDSIYDYLSVVEERKVILEPYL